MHISTLHKAFEAAGKTQQDNEKAAISAVRDLTDDEMAELIVTMGGQLRQQQEENARLKAAQQEEATKIDTIAKGAGQFNTFWKTGLIVVGILSGLATTSIFAGGMYSDWKKLTAAHESGDATSAGLNHRSLYEEDIVAIAAALKSKGLTADTIDLSAYALKAEVNAPDLTDYVRVGDEIKLRYASNQSGKYLSSVEFNVVTGDKFGLWAIEK